jgi:adenylyltransferase/sulfurtransferase
VPSSPADLTAAELDRYTRQTVLPEFGVAAQRRLKNSSVLCIGAGGLGSPAAIHLAAAGVGRITIVDPDTVERSNLHRQILHGESMLGRPKTESAAARLRDINPHVEILVHPVRFTPDNAMDIARGHDLIVDGSDNFPTRFLVNDVAFFLRIPQIFGAIQRFEGQLGVFAPHLGGPCLRCMMPSLPPPETIPSCAEAGVLGVLPGIVGTLQANEAIKLLTGLGDPAIGRLVHFDALSLRFRELPLARDPGCRLCGGRPTISSPDNAETRTGSACPASEPPVAEIDAAALHRRIASPTPEKDGRLVILDVRSISERAETTIANSLHIPMRDLETAPDILTPESEIIVFCAHGIRSLTAARRLRNAGFRHVSHVAGGIREWIAKDFPVVRG